MAETDTVTILENRNGHSAAVVAESVEELCSICQSSIETYDEAITCSACGLPYHRDCWEENLGCATYGCRNVEVLRQGPDVTVSR